MISKDPTGHSSVRRIVIHSALFPPTQGGAELYVYNFLKSLRDLYSVTIMTRPTTARWNVGLRHRVVRLPSWAIPLYFLWIVLRKRVHVFHVGLVGYESLILFLIARIARIPCILTYHGTYSLADRETIRQIPRVVFLFENIVMRLPWGAIVCVDAFSLRFLSSHFRVSQGRLWLVPSGVDSELFRPAVLTENSRPKEYIILCPRRIDPKNGIEFLIHATLRSRKHIPNLTLLVAGRTGQGMEGHEKHLRQVVQANGGGECIRFLGDVEHRKMPGLYNATDVVIIPSLAEARSLSALEAMACAKPVIASRVGGLPERNARTTAMENAWTKRSEVYETIYEALLSRKFTPGLRSASPAAEDHSFTAELCDDDVPPSHALSQRCLAKL